MPRGPGKPRGAGTGWGALGPRALSGLIVGVFNTHTHTHTHTHRYVALCNAAGLREEQFILVAFQMGAVLATKSASLACAPCTGCELV